MSNDGIVVGSVILLMSILLLANSGRSVVEQQHAEFLGCCCSFIRPILHFGLSLIVVATTLQNAVAATATTTSLSGAYQLDLRKVQYSNLGLVLKNGLVDGQLKIKEYET